MRRSAGFSVSCTRRELLASTGMLAAASWGKETGMDVSEERGPLYAEIAARVRRTPFVDTHEHLVEEESRINWQPSPVLPCNDWALLFSHYLDSDLVVAGMPEADRARLLSPETDLRAKWTLVERWWPLVRYTGYGQALSHSIQTIHGIRDLNGTTVRTLEEKYHAAIRQGFYRRILCDLAGVECCQVNSLERTFMPSTQPLLLMQDIVISNLHTPEAWRANAEPTGVQVASLGDYHRVLDWWFETYGPYAVAVKCGAAYARRLDFEDVPPEKAADPFRKLVHGEPIAPEDRRLVEDHLFWYCVRKATEYGLPVKLHTGYYAGYNSMPMHRLATNPGDITELLRKAPDTKFVLMHICYPFYEEMVAIAKQWRNAYVDMCWAWIVSPDGAQRFLRSMLMAAPRNKVLTFGGDYIPVELVVGHAALARTGITAALTGLVEDGWLSRNAAVEMVEPIMRGNARALFRLDEKEKALRQAPWLSAASPGTPVTE